MTRRTLCAVLLAALAGTGCSSVRHAEIQTEPAGATLFVDDQKIGTAPVTWGFDFADPDRRYRVEARREGYVTNHKVVSSLYLDTLEEKPIVIPVQEDEAWNQTVPSEAANAWVELETNPRLDAEQVWNLLVSTVNKYYTKLANLEPQAGYIAAQEKVQTFRRGNANTRVRNQFFCSIASEKPLVYKVKIESQILEDGKWVAFERILAEDQGLIEELQNRLAAVE